MVTVSRKRQEVPSLRAAARTALACPAAIALPATSDTLLVGAGRKLHLLSIESDDLRLSSVGCFNDSADQVTLESALEAPSGTAVGSVLGRDLPALSSW